jgi:Tol biopolymer transport system component
MTRIVIRPVLTLSLVLLLMACQSNQALTVTVSPAPASTSTQPPATPSAVPYRTIALRGQFVFAPGDSSIWIQDAASFQARPLLKHRDQEYYESPSFSPDGSQIVFVAYTFDQSGAQIKEIRAINADGTNSRTLFKPPSNGQRTYLGDPRYSPDGASIYFSLSTVQGDTVRKQTNQIVRGPATGGNWQVILDDGDHPVLSGDGKRLAFLRFNPQRFRSSLWVANSEGGQPQQLLVDDVFAGVTGQRFSPDGKWIVFAASGPPSRTLPGMSLRLDSPGQSALQHEEESCAFGIGSACLVQLAYADGLPWDIWLVSVDGKTFKQLTQLGLDSPWPAFSRDGRYIAFISTNGLFVYDRETNRVSLLDKERAHGVMDWFQE